jgi:hypothetical protein
MSDMPYRRNWATCCSNLGGASRTGSRICFFKRAKPAFRTSASFRTTVWEMDIPVAAVREVSAGRPFRIDCRMTGRDAQPELLKR